MSIRESGEMYLETILILSKTKSSIRAIDIVEHMGFSKPSVSRALGKLRSDKFIVIDKSGFIAFTEEGKKIAEKIYNRHIILTDFIAGLGVDSETASADACKIEHVISDKTFAAIKKFQKKK